MPGLGIGIGLQFRKVSGNKTWYVRPSGGSYGAEDGTSYDNAWDGFTNIVWGSINPGDRLVVSGTHEEVLEVGASGTASSPITISFYESVAYAGAINGGDSIAICMDTNDKSYINILSELTNKAS